MSETSDVAVIPISSARSHQAQDDAGGGMRDVDRSSVAREYAALHTSALLVDHADRALWTFRGAMATATITGLVTNDVAGLMPAHGCYAAALTPKGRIVADVRVFACDQAAFPERDGVAGWLDDVALLIDVPPRAAPGWSALIRKFVNPRVTPFRDETERLHAFGIYGVRARDAIAEVFGAPPAALAALPPYAYATIVLDGEPVLVARIPDLGVDGFLVVGLRDQRERAWSRLRDAVPGVIAGGPETYAIARVEAGYPEWGVDIDETTIPQEANLDDLHAISYTKGCYTGQEVVARIHFRGHVNRHLRGLTFASDAAIPTGAELVLDTRVVGDVRSSVHSPRLGGIALGMVRREVEPGATLTARWPGGEHAVTVAPLPFPSASPP